MSLPNSYSKEQQVGKRPVKAKKGLKSRKPIKKRNAKREGRMFAGTRDDAFMAWLHEFPCALCMWFKTEQKSPTEVEHWVKRSAGGKDRGETFPTCAEHRELRHGKPAEFARLLKKSKLNLDKLCARLKAQYELEQCPCP